MPFAIAWPAAAEKRLGGGTFWRGQSRATNLPPVERLHVHRDADEILRRKADLMEAASLKALRADLR